MKVKIALILCLIFSSGIYAADAQICETGGVPSVSNEGLNTIMVAGIKISGDEFNSIRVDLCKDIKISYAEGFSPTRFKQIILNGVGVKQSASNANEVVSSFLNDHKNKLVCDKNGASSTSRNMLLFKSALLDGVIDLYDEILLDDEEYEIDFNGYEVVNGKKETVLDYIDKLIDGDNDDSDELESIREVIVELGGKKGVEL